MNKPTLLAIALTIVPVACTGTAGSEAGSVGASDTESSGSTGSSDSEPGEAGTVGGSSGGVPDSSTSTAPDDTTGGDGSTTPGSSDDDGTSSSSSTTASTTAETGDDDSSSSSGGEPVWDGPCPPYSGLADVGSTWEAASTPAYEAANNASYTWHREVISVSAGNPTTVTLLLTQPTVVETGSYTTALTYTYVCDEDGAALLRLESETAGTINGQPFETWNNTDYSPPWLVTPWGIEVGSQWTAASNMTTTSSQGTFTSSAAHDIEVVAEDSETVLGLAHDCLRIEWDNGMGSGGWYCVDAAVGSLRTSFNSDTLTAVDVVPW
ncbi:MAG: hypothetical protein ACRBN8_40905 [Nannocystales bacterium]